jgi:flagellar hook-associated protein 2
MASGIQLSGLASGFDWKSFTDSIIQLERSPATRYSAEKSRNDLAKGALSEFGAKVSALRTAVKSLSDSTVVADRVVFNESPSGRIAATVTSKTPVGAYSISMECPAIECSIVGDDIITPIAAGAPSRDELDAANAIVSSGGELTIKVGEKEEVTISVGENRTIAQIVSQINSSGAGVTAVTNGVKIVLRSQYSGAKNDIVVGGDMAETLGLSGEPTHGSDASFSINGLNFTSEDNVFDEQDHGIAGLSLTAPSSGVTTEEVVRVSADKAGLRKLIDDFVSSYNDLASFVAEKTSISTEAGKARSGPLSGNREVQTWLAELRSRIFKAPAFGAIGNLSYLGLDFSRDDDKIKVVNSAKLDAVLAANSADVMGFFRADGVGLGASILEKLNSVAGEDGTGGLLKTKLDSYDKANLKLDDQIAALDRYLEQRRAQLEAGFMAMETAQSKMSQIQTMLTNQFGQKK